jgi:hypothetical protein
MGKGKQDRPKERHIFLDKKTHASLQAIAEASDNLSDLVEIADVDPVAFADFAKEIGQQDCPEVKEIIKAAKLRQSDPRP